MNPLNIFRTALLAVALSHAVTGSLAAADWDHENYKLADIGGIKVVIFEDTKSRDGHFALGWTLQPVDKTAPPVDWTKWNSGDRSSMDQYQTRDEANQKAPYRDVDCVVDFQRKMILPLPAEMAFCPYNTHGGIYVSWGPETDGRRCAFVQIDASFRTLNFWLVSIDQNGMRPMELAPRLTKQALRVVGDKRPLGNFSDYEFGVKLGDNGRNKREIAFHAQSADIPFDADIPKHPDSTSDVKGWITVRLPKGAVEKAWSDTPLDDPFVNDPKLAKADRELNQVYAALLQKTKPAMREALKKEQRDWILQRDGDASGAVSDARGNEEDPPIARNKSLLESTQKRTAELRQRLAGH